MLLKTAINPSTLCLSVELPLVKIQCQLWVSLDLYFFYSEHSVSVITYQLHIYGWKQKKVRVSYNFINQFLTLSYSWLEIGLVQQYCARQVVTNCQYCWSFGLFSHAGFKISTERTRPDRLHSAEIFQGTKVKQKGNQD